MGKEILMFGDTEIFNKIYFGEKKYKYFIGYWSLGVVV